MYGFGPFCMTILEHGTAQLCSSSFLHSSLDRDILSFGYPGFGSFGASRVWLELKTLKSLGYGPRLKIPKKFFRIYEGNDLVNNLHELEQRVSLQKPISAELIFFEKFFKLNINLKAGSWIDQLCPGISHQESLKIIKQRAVMF